MGQLPPLLAPVTGSLQAQASASSQPTSFPLPLEPGGRWDGCARASRGGLGQVGAGHTPSCPFCESSGAGASVWGGTGCQGSICSHCGCPPGQQAPPSRGRPCPAAPQDEHTPYRRTHDPRRPHPLRAGRAPYAPRPAPLLPLQPLGEAARGGQGTAGSGCSWRRPGEAAARLPLQDGGAEEEPAAQCERRGGNSTPPHVFPVPPSRRAGAPSSPTGGLQPGRAGAEGGAAHGLGGGAVRDVRLRQARCQFEGVEPGVLLWAGHGPRCSCVAPPPG